jgi:Aldehyde dehydrogenase family
LLFLLALNPESTMGSVISPRHLEGIEAIIRRRESGDILAGGERMMGTSALDGFDFSQGSFFPPTVIEGVRVADDLWREELFGPVVIVKRFSVGRALIVDGRHLSDFSLGRPSKKALTLRTIVNMALVRAFGLQTYPRHIVSLRKSSPGSAG